MLERSHRCATLVARRSGSNFYRSFALLPRDKRRAMTALYAFARQTDDLGDSIGTAAERQQHLKAWRAATVHTLCGGDPAATGEPTTEGRASEGAGDRFMPAVVCSSATDLLPALADTVLRYEIPHQHLLEIIDGVIADQTQRRYETMEELEHYCYLVASAVGLACLHIWQYRSELPRQAAVDCGVAFQLTNILRDVREDARRGRIYLPRELWAPRGLIEADFLASEPPATMIDVCREVAEQAGQRYARGWEVCKHLHPDGRRMFSMIWRTYRILLDRILADPAAIFRQRIELRHRDRLRIFGGHFGGPLFRRLSKWPA